jgi:photosystem II stability/assembly factor-like uncharacterized protein
VTLVRLAAVGWIGDVYAWCGLGGSTIILHSRNEAAKLDAMGLGMQASQSLVGAMALVMNG